MNLFGTIHINCQAWCKRGNGDNQNHFYCRPPGSSWQETAGVVVLKTVCCFVQTKTLRNVNIGRQLVCKPLIICFPSFSRCVDLRTVSYEVPPQEMLSRDSVTVSVDAVCFYKISNPLAAVCNVGNYTHSTNLLVATSLRNVLGTKVDDLLTKAKPTSFVSNT